MDQYEGEYKTCNDVYEGEIKFFRPLLVYSSDISSFVKNLRNIFLIFFFEGLRTRIT